MRVQVLFLVLQNRKKDGFIYLDKNKNIEDSAEVWHCYSIISAEVLEE